MDLVCTHCNCKTLCRFCIVIYCHCLSVSELGNLRTCCHPWMYSPFLRRILRNQTLIPRIRRILERSLSFQQDDKSEIWMKRRRASLRTRSDKLLWITNEFWAPAEPALLLFGMPDRLYWFCKSNKYRRAHEARAFLACISSRITAVIQLDPRQFSSYDQINDCWFKEIFAVFSYKLSYTWTCMV